MSKFKEIAVTFGIAVLFTTFILVTIDAFYPEPEYEDFCKRQPIPKPIKEKVECEDVDEDRISMCYEQDMEPIYIFDENGCRVFKECSTCRLDYDKARDDYDRNLFLIVAPLGIIAIILGTIYTIEFIGGGFMFSGIILLFYSTVRYFNDMERWLRPIVMLIELIIILWLAYKKIVPQKKKKSK